MKSMWLPPTEPQEAAVLAAAGYDPLVASILASRGITTPEAALDFTDPYLGLIHKPALLPDIAKAAQLVKQAISEGWPVRLITDYDVDGQTSGALFFLFLRDQYRAAGQDPDLVDCFTPNRFSEGYGLNKNHILGAGMDGKKLVITFDCGIRSHDEGDLAREMGLRLIITDHHEPEGASIPHADAVINPKRLDSQYPFRDICGCVVALKLAWAVGGSLRKLTPYLDMAAVATVADMMPITDENRAILHYGLMVLNGEHIEYDGDELYPGGRRPAFEALLEGKAILETDIGFKVGPPLNALGRMGDANRGIRFLAETDRDQLKEYRREIDEDNALRKQIQQQVIDQVCASIDPNAPPAAIVYSSTFESLGDNARKVEGVVGIAAGKVGDQFHAPAIVLAEHGGIAKGSARAIVNLDLHHTLAQIDHLLMRWGGHQAAAGLSLKPEDIPALRAHMIQSVQGLDPAGLVKQFQVDAVIDGADLRWSQSGYPILTKLDTLRPFGKGNPVPLLMLEGVQVRSAKSVGKTGTPHLKLLLEADGVAFEAMAWREWERYVDAGQPERLDVLGEAGINDWSGKLQLTLTDWRIA